MVESSEKPQALPCACSALRQTTRAVSRHYEACLAPTGVTTTQYSILRYLQREGAKALRRVADALELERTSLYRAIAPLAESGFVVLQKDPADARVKVAVLNPRGVDKINEILPHWHRAQASFLKAVGGDAWRSVSEQLLRFREDLTQEPLIQGQLARANKSRDGGAKPAPPESNSKKSFA